MRFDVFKKTTENWCGSFLLSDDPDIKLLIKVSLVITGPTPPQNGKWRVCVWGNDDFGMERDFDEENVALDYFQKVIKLENVTTQALKNLGFVRA